MSAKIKLTTLIRLQQCLGGFATDDTKTIRPIDPVCPRMAAVQDLCEQTPGKVVVWAVYRAEIEALAQLLGGEAFYGNTTDKERKRIDQEFRDPNSKLRILVGHTKSGGLGRNWQVAQTMIYYSNGYSVEGRLQSEDRVHRIGQQGTVTIYDLDAQEVPLDATIRNTLKQGKDLSDQVLAATNEEFRSLV